MSPRQLARQRELAAQLGSAHGYRFEGDRAFINAELVLPAFFSAQSFALELWACAGPHQGGALQGTKICEVPLDLPTPLTAYVHHVEARADARLPEHGNAHAMVLALVEKLPEGETVVYDFSNYPVLQLFEVPHFEGGVGYSLHAGEVALRADAIINPRVATNLSGTLSLELWAWPEASGDTEREGVCLAAAALPRLDGQHMLTHMEVRAPFTEPPVGRWRIALLLREWASANAYVTRDRRSFARAYERDAPPASKARRKGVSIHTASIEQLAKVKGLNLRLAKEIVNARPLASLDELTKVRGIGARTLERIKPFLTL